MGCRLTSGGNKVAMYDSVDGIAFGPVLDDHWEAEDWMTWFRSGKATAFAREHGWVFAQRVDLTDPRCFTVDQLKKLHAAFVAEREAALEGTA